MGRRVVPRPSPGWDHVGASLVGARGGVRGYVITFNRPVAKGSPIGVGEDERVRAVRFRPLPCPAPRAPTSQRPYGRPECGCIRAVPCPTVGTGCPRYDDKRVVVGPSPPHQARGRLQEPVSKSGRLCGSSVRDSRFHGNDGMSGYVSYRTNFKTTVIVASFAAKSVCSTCETGSPTLSHEEKECGEARCSHASPGWDLVGASLVGASGGVIAGWNVVAWSRCVAEGVPDRSRGRRVREWVPDRVRHDVAFPRLTGDTRYLPNLVLPAEAGIHGGDGRVSFGYGPAPRNHVPPPAHRAPTRDAPTGGQSAAVSALYPAPPWVPGVPGKTRE